MLKKLLFFLILISYSVQSQNFVKGKLNPPEDYSWVVLYQLKGAKQLYIKNTTIADGKFTVELPKNATKGMYRLMYSQNGNGIVDFIYNKENIELSFDPENPTESVAFFNSNENETFHKYKRELAQRMSKLDSLQRVFFSLKDDLEKNKTNKNYEVEYNKLNEFQYKFENSTKGSLANHFIKSSKKYYAPNLIETPQEYLNSEKLHYFDFIDFDDKELRNSIFLTQKVVDYVFYLNGSDDIQVQNSLFKSAVNDVFKNINDDDLRSEMVTILLHSFAQIENTVLIDYVIENYYNKLPESLQDKSIVEQVQEKVKLAVGKIAPDFTWKDKGEIKKLSAIDVAENYVVVFWSTTCSHCLVEVPQLYEYIKGNDKVHVIAIALEKDELGFKHHTAPFTKWTNVLGLNKWQNEIAKDYEITSTPSYFVLDSNKKIIAKPEYFKDVKDFFDKK